MMAVDAQTLALIEELYLCGLEPGAWYSALQAFAEGIGAAGCLLNPEDAGSLVGLRPSNELTDVLAGFVAGGWHLNDHRSERGWKRVRDGQRIILEHDIATDDERRGKPFYQEWAEPSGLPWWAAIGLRVGSEYWSVPLLRTARQGAFTPEDAQRLALLAPHLERVIGFAQRIAAGQNDGRLDVLERLGCGCIVLDWSGMVARCNGAAEEVFGHDLIVRQGQLIARDPASNQRLQTLIQRSVRSETSSAAMRVSIKRMNASPLLVEALHVSSGISELFYNNTAVLMIEGARTRHSLSATEIREAFALTHAEAKLAVLVGSGHEVSQAAAELGIGKETARSQLKSVFAKTGTHRQAKLVSLLAPYRR
jgi:DNA-binding CsgD family transcriptional regulator